VAAKVLKNLGVELGDARLQVERLVPVQPEAVAREEPRHTTQTEKVLEYAAEEARNLRHNWVGTEHIILGLLHEQEGPAAQALANLGLSPERIRSEVLVLLGHHVDVLGAMRRSPEMKDRAMFKFVGGKNAKDICSFLGPDAVDRVIANLKEDARAFGIPEKGSDE
jgi:ATP-dependent Clp protease ATP-binding subunit ClpC